jgi:hypothetical protein
VPPEAYHAMELNSSLRPPALFTNLRPCTHTTPHVPYAPAPGACPDQTQMPESYGAPAP